MRYSLLSSILLATPTVVVSAAKALRGPSTSYLNMTAVREHLAGNNIIHTPFGYVHSDCHLALPANTTARELENGTVLELHHANGTVERRQACQSFPKAPSPRLQTGGAEPDSWRSTNNLEAVLGESSPCSTVHI